MENVFPFYIDFRPPLHPNPAHIRAGKSSRKSALAVDRLDQFVGHRQNLQRIPFYCDCSRGLSVGVFEELVGVAIENGHSRQQLFRHDLLRHGQFHPASPLHHQLGRALFQLSKNTCLAEPWQPLLHPVRGHGRYRERRDLSKK